MGNLKERLESGELTLPTEAEVKTKFCSWSRTADGFWETDCKNAFNFENGGPVEDGFNFCPYCGKRIDRLD